MRRRIMLVRRICEQKKIEKRKRKTLKVPENKAKIRSNNSTSLKTKKIKNL